MDLVGLFLKKRTWTINLAVIAICSVFAGRAGAHLLEASFLVDDDLPPRRRLVIPPPQMHDKNGVAIVARDVFCSGCMTPAEKAAAVKTAEDAKKEPEKTALSLALLATLMTGNEATSMAVLRDLSTPQKDAAMLGRGATVFATGATVDLVTERRVYLRVAGHLEFLDLDDSTQPKPSKAPPLPVTSFAPDSFSAEMDRGVSCNGTSCQIDRALVEHLLQNTMALATSARFVPSIRDGRPNGFRLYAIRPGSIFARIGLQNGDTIKAINGNDMTTPDAALALYSRLRNASHLAVQLERRGATTMLDYIIR